MKALRYLAGAAVPVADAWSGTFGEGAVQLTVPEDLWVLAPPKAPGFVDSVSAALGDLRAAAVHCVALRKEPFGR